MGKKIYYHDDFTYTVILDEKIIQQMLWFCKEKMPLETGGILVGKYSDEGTSAKITNISGPPKDSKHGKSTFYRGVKGLTPWLSELWTTTGEYYLGEWHFHPHFFPVPSPIDHRQMKQISKDSRYHCPEPILFIIGGDPDGKWYTSCYVFHRNGSMITLKEE
jgi:integrative and conjugative element protein (TIGR02256 family)